MHETAVGWMRARLAASTPAFASRETVEEYAHRLKTVCADINATLDVDGLCRGFPQRLQAVLDNKGERIRH